MGWCCSGGGLAPEQRIRWSRPPSPVSEEIWVWSPLPKWLIIGVGVLVPVTLYGTEIPFVNRGGRTSMGRTAQGTTPAAAGQEPEAEAGTRPLRADAARNRARILDAAETVFAAEGIE